MTDMIAGSRPVGTTKRGKGARNIIWAGCFEPQIVGHRLLHRAHVFNIKGHSYRLRDLEDALKD